MKNILIKIEDNLYEEINSKKGKRTWQEILLAGINSEDGGSELPQSLKDELFDRIQAVEKSNEELKNSITKLSESSAQSSRSSLEALYARIEAIETELNKIPELEDKVENSITKLSESPKQLSGINIEPLLARISQNESEIASLSTLEFFKKKFRESSTFLEFASNSSYKVAMDSIGKVIFKKLEKIGILKFDPNVEEKFVPGEFITATSKFSEILREFNLRLGDIEDKIDILEQSISKRNEKDRETAPDQKPVEEVEEEKEEPELVPADQI